jgi:hypothetical protein
MRDEVVNHARELTAVSPLEREVKSWFHVSLKPEEAKELAKVIAKARAKYNRSNTLFSDFDWAHFVQEFLADKGYKFTKMVARDMNRQAVASELVKVAKLLSASKETDEITRIAVKLTQAESQLADLVEQMSSSQTVSGDALERKLRRDAAKKLKSAMFLVRDALENVSDAKKLIQD